MDQSRQQIANLFGQGPVLLFFDGTAPAHQGLSDAMHHAIVCAQLAGPNDKARVLAATEFLDVTYGGEGGVDHHAKIAMKAVFCIARRVGPQPHIIAAANLPKCLGDQPQVNLSRLLSGAGILPQQPIWSYPDTHAELDALAEVPPPDKKTALDRLRSVSGGVWLLLRPQVEGLRVATDASHLPAHMLFLTPDTQNLQLDDAGISWQQPMPTGLQAMHVPWLAIGGMRTPDAMHGWFWPLDLPEPTQTRLQQDPTVWQRMVERGCVSHVPAPAMPPFIVMSPPQHVTPQQALQFVQDHGAGMILVDRHRENVQVPTSLRAQPIVAVPIGLHGMTAMVVAETDGLTATMPDADGRPALLRAPWDGVLMVTSMGGIAHATWNWPGHATPELLHDMTAGSTGDGVIAFDQPCGPPQAQGIPLIRVEFHIRRGGVH